MGEELLTRLKNKARARFYREHGRFPDDENPKDEKEVFENQVIMNLKESVEPMRKKSTLWKTFVGPRQKPTKWGGPKPQGPHKGVKSIG